MTSINKAPHGSQLQKSIKHAFVDGDKVFSSPIGIFDNGVNVKWFGAKGDVFTDDTAAIQAAIDSLTAEGGVIFFPVGLYKISTALINNSKKLITLKGSGWVVKTNDVFGSTQWDNDVDAVHGSVIYQSSATENGVTFTMAGALRTRIEDMAFRGPGSGTTIGVSLVGSGTKYTLSNVGIFNFATGLQQSNMFDCTYFELSIRGCTTGINFTSSPNNNQNSFYNTLIEACGTGISLNGGNSNNFYGGLLQNIVTDGIVITDENVSYLHGFHFESTTITGHDIRVETTGTTSDLRISGNRLSSKSTAGIILNGGSRTFLDNNRILTGVMTIDVTAANTTLLHNNLAGATYTNNSSTTTRIDAGTIDGRRITIEDGVTLGHDQANALKMKDSGGTARDILFVDSGDLIKFGGSGLGSIFTLNTIQLSAGAFDGVHFIMGGHHFWMNGNDFRGGIGVPSSATDGVLIATLT